MGVYVKGWIAPGAERLERMAAQPPQQSLGNDGARGIGFPRKQNMQAIFCDGPAPPRKQVNTWSKGYDTVQALSSASTPKAAWAAASLAMGTR